MADFNWDQYPHDEPKAFDWNQYEAEAPAHPERGFLETAGSYLDSGARGIAQAASGGFLDELTGAIRSPIGAAKEIANKFGAGYDDQSVRDYKSTRDIARGLDQSAHDANPGTFLAGNLAGAAASLPAGAASSLAGMAGIGAAQGIGNAQSDSLGGIATDAAMGAGLGAAGYGLAKAIPKAAEFAGDQVGSLGEKLKPKPPSGDWALEGDAWVRTPPPPQAKSTPNAAFKTAKDIALDYVPGGKLVDKLVGKSAAPAFDKIGDILKTAPERLGKFAGPLRDAEMRGPAARATTHFILQETQPEYRELMKNLEEESQ